MAEALGGPLILRFTGQEGGVMELGVKRNAHACPQITQIRMSQGWDWGSVWWHMFLTGPQVTIIAAPV